MQCYCLCWRPAFPVVACGWSQYHCPSLSQVLLHAMFWDWPFPYAPTDHNGDTHIPTCSMAPTSTIIIHYLCCRWRPTSLAVTCCWLRRPFSPTLYWCGCSVSLASTVAAYCLFHPSIVATVEVHGHHIAFSNLKLVYIHTHTYGSSETHTN